LAADQTLAAEFWRKVLCGPTGQVCLFQYRWELGRSGLGPVVQCFEGIRAEIRRWIPGISCPHH
jgi:hypothetical protein